MAKSKRKKQAKIKHLGSSQINSPPIPPPIKVIPFYIKPNARQDRVYYDGEHFCIDISAPPVKSKANLAIVKLLSQVLNLPTTQIQLIKGHTSTTKWFRFNSPLITIDTLPKLIKVHGEQNEPSGKKK